MCVQNDGANVTLVRAGFNTIFKVVNPASTTTDTDADAASVPIPGAAFMVRVAASAWGYTLQQLASEPMWLRALRADTDVKVLHTARMHSARFVIAHFCCLQVPDPVAADSGEFVFLHSDGTETEQPVLVFKWMDGTVDRKKGAPWLRKLGVAMAKMHVQAASWTPPADFSRREYSLIPFGHPADVESKAVPVAPAADKDNKEKDSSGGGGGGGIFDGSDGSDGSTGASGGAGAGAGAAASGTSTEMMISSAQAAILKQAVAVGEELLKNLLSRAATAATAAAAAAGGSGEGKGRGVHVIHGDLHLGNVVWGGSHDDPEAAVLQVQCVRVCAA